MSTLFRWQPSDLDGLLATCERDGLAPFLDRYAPPGCHVLEAGCGPARYVRYLADRGRRPVGLEYVAETVHMTRARWPDLVLVCGDAARMPLADATFDAVLSLGVVEHWPQGPQPPLRELHRVLRTGGVALITVPCLNAFRRWKRRWWLDEILHAPRALAGRIFRGRSKPLARQRPGSRFAEFPPYGPFFEYRMTPDEFRTEIERAEFRILEHVPFAFLDGLYYDFNPFGLLVRFPPWQFDASPQARAVSAWFSRRPFFHCHMQLIVAEKGSL